MDVDRFVQPGGDFGKIDTVRALLHDLRQPLAAIGMLASVDGDGARRMHAITEQVTWLTAVVESALELGSHDALALIDAHGCVVAACERARESTTTQITVDAVGQSVAWARPIALGRALSCLLDNAIRAAGPDGHVCVHLEDEGAELALRIVDDGPGLGRVPARTSLGLTTTRAMVAACYGSFRLEAAPSGGAVAEIRLPSAARVRLVQ